MPWTRLSAQTRARREADLQKMRDRYKRVHVPRPQSKPRPAKTVRELTLRDLGWACVLAGRTAENPLMKEALEEASKYFYDAAKE